MSPLEAAASQPDAPCRLLGGLSPARFMRRHWQRRPLLVRGAWPGAGALLPRAALFDLAAEPHVESRLVVHDARGWRVRRGPIPRRALPSVRVPRWTLLVQGLDLHVPAARTLLSSFRFLPDARLDDLMLSWASDGGGVGPHLDSYDVFLLQLEGRRRWRVGPVAEPSWQADAPLRLLARFEPSDEWLLEPGDMLYLPPGWGHEGVAQGECTTASIGFRAPTRRTLAADLLGRIADRLGEDAEQGDAGERRPAASNGERRYGDRGQAPTARPGRIPRPLQRFAADAVRRALHDHAALEIALGESLSEPKPQVVFDGLDVSSEADAALAAAEGGGVALDARSRMLYDRDHAYLNGESWRVGGDDARLLRRFADRRRLEPRDVAEASSAVRALLGEWLRDGWVVASHDGEGGR